jgi:predicted nucleotide-binding protein
MQETENEELYVTIFLSSTNSTLGKEVDEYIEVKLGHEVITRKLEPRQTTTDIEVLERETGECAFAILVLTQSSGRSRENICHEIGYCQGTFGHENVLVLRQDGVEAFAGLNGIMYEVFAGDNIKSTFPRIRAEIDAALERFTSEEDDEAFED